MMLPLLDDSRQLRSLVVRGTMAPLAATAPGPGFRVEVSRRVTQSDVVTTRLVEGGHVHRGRAR